LSTQHFTAKHVPKLFGTLECHKAHNVSCCCLCKSQS